MTTPAEVLTPSDRVVGVPGTTIVVSVARVPSTPNEVTLHIWRNGKTETRFTFAELTAVGVEVTRQLSMARIPGPAPAKP